MADAYVVSFLLGDILKNLSSTWEPLASNIIGGNCANMHNTIPALLITEHSYRKVTLILIWLIFIVFTFGSMPSIFIMWIPSASQLPFAASLLLAYLVWAYILVLPSLEDSLIS